MKSTAISCPSFSVNLQLQVPGPIMPRRKYKEHKLLTASAKRTLPFIPFPGLILTFAIPKRRGLDSHVYLRIRTVEWVMSSQEFDCVVDEISLSPDLSDVFEVRGSPRIPQHFLELENYLRYLGFETRTDMQSLYWAIHKTASGIELGEPEWATAPPPTNSPRQR